MKTEWIHLTNGAWVRRDSIDSVEVRIAHMAKETDKNPIFNVIVCAGGLQHLSLYPTQAKAKAARDAILLQLGAIANAELNPPKEPVAPCWPEGVR